jgi:hypothetical protein
MMNRWVKMRKENGDTGRRGEWVRWLRRRIAETEKREAGRV